MNNIEWEQIWALMTDLWPRNTADLTGEQQAAYRRVMDRAILDDCRWVLRTLAEESKWFPKPVDVRDRLKARYGDRRDARGETHRESEEREAIERERFEIKTLLEALTPEELAGHKRMVLAGNKTLRWLAGADPIRYLGLRAHVYHRLQDGLTPEDRRTRVWFRDQMGEASPRGR